MIHEDLKFEMIDEPPPAQDAFRRGVSTGTSLAYMSSILSFLASRDETGGGLSVAFFHGRQGNEPPPHVHHREHELYYVVDGEMAAYVEGHDEALRAGQGELLFLPRGRAHVPVFLSPEVQTLCILHALDGERVGFEPLLKAMADGPATSMTLPDPAERYAILDTDALEAVAWLAEEHGVSLLSPDEVGRRLPGYAGSKHAKPAPGEDDITVVGREDPADRTA